MDILVLLLSILSFTSANTIKLLNLTGGTSSHLSNSPPEVPEKRIINGAEAQPGQFPYQALLTSSFGIEATVLCGGTLLSQNYVLTAAHCVQWQGELAHVLVTLGVQNRQLEEPTQQHIEIDHINVHPEYDPPVVINDIATIRLATPAVLNEYVRPVELPAVSDTRTFSGITGTLSGFGRTDDVPGSPPSDVLRFTRNPILTNGNCQSQIHSFRPNFQLAPQHMCFSGMGPRSACQSDSGGPLTIRDGDRTVQVGITSFVLGGICSIGVPTGFVRVTHFLSWIEDNSDVVVRH